MRILITGGAGFIGSHLADALLERGDEVRAFDNLSPQVHGDALERPPYLDSAIELLQGDVRDGAAVRRALDGVDAVYHAYTIREIAEMLSGILGKSIEPEIWSTRCSWRTSGSRTRRAMRSTWAAAPPAP